MTPSQKNEDLKSYRTFGLTLLQLMGLIFVAGVTLTLVVHYLGCF